MNTLKIHSSPAMQRRLKALRQMLVKAASQSGINMLGIRSRNPGISTRLCTYGGLTLTIWVLVAPHLRSEGLHWLTFAFPFPSKISDPDYCYIYMQLVTG